MNIFTEQFKKQADEVVARYETKRASLLEILHLVMETYGYVSVEAEEAVADYLKLPPMDVHEVVTFYTLYYRQPKAKTRFNVCRTLSCSLAGSDRLIKHFEEKLGIKAGQKSADGKCGLQAVECLGACEMAPMLQVNDDEYVGGLTKERIDELIKKYMTS
ncbi:MAG: NAD(P)H-dependent oxidoreductase subunit E [Candidatus Omnitrophica bacterium]|nr:NAD(P)H-dependent oxidoreductase subunit E [Candidatus Omnitrophota bacterium]